MKTQAFFVFSQKISLHEHIYEMHVPSLNMDLKTKLQIK